MIRAIRLSFVFALLAVPAFAQTAADRATLYTEIDTLFADTGQDPITPAQLRQSLKNITASSTNLLTDTSITATNFYSTGNVGFGTSTPLQRVHIKSNSATLPGLVAGNMGHDYYGLVVESEDAVLGLVSRNEGGHGSGIDLMEVNSGTLQNKWFIGRDSSGSGSTLQFSFGTNAAYENNTTYFEFSTAGNFSLTAASSNLGVGTTSENGTITLGAATNGTDTILSKTADAADSRRIAIGGGGSNSVTRGAYINLMGNEYSAQEGDLALLAGDSAMSGKGRIRFFTGTQVEAAAIDRFGDLDVFTVTDASTGDGSITTLGGIYAAKKIISGTGFTGALTGNVTGNVTGSSGSTTGNAATATALATPRAIYGNNFDGSAALTQVIASTYGGTGNGFAKFSGPTTSEKTFTLPNSSATLLYSGGDAGTPSALVGTNISGTAASLTAGAASTLATPRTIGNVSFDGSANIVPETSAVVDSTDSTSFPLMVDSATGNLQHKTDAGLTYNATTGVLTATGFAGPLTGNVTGNVTGSSGSTTGNAATATALATPRAIYGNNFDGSAALTQIIASTYGGTGNGFTKFSGPTTSEKTFTLPNSSATLLYSGGDAGTPSALVGTNISGTAASLTAGAASTLATPRTIGNVSFNGSANIVPETIAIVDSTDATSFPLIVDSATGSLQPKTDAGLSYDASTGTLTATLLATGAIGIGTTPAVANPINIAANTSGTTPTGVWVQQAIQSSATGYYYGFISYPSVANSAFTLPSLVHFSAFPSSLGASATVTVQTGFEATSSIVGATNNYGFRGRIASGSGQYNLYMDGTALNYLAGVLQLNSTIELGHATDTTIARVSAGLISVEGVNVSTETYAQTAAKATKLGSHASPDTTAGSITWATSAVYEVWTNTTTTYALPAASGYEGKAVIFYVTGTNAITIDPNSSEVIVRDGTAQTGGVTMTLTGAAGNYVCLVCDGTRWITLGYKGTLAAGS